MKNRFSTAVVYDLDSTISHNEHRFPLLPAEGGDWDAYALACHADTPIKGVVATMRLHIQHHQLHICSGRSGVALDMTRDWLSKHKVPYDYLRLRHSSDPHSNSQLKIDYIKQLQGDGISVAVMYEDWLPVARKIEEETGVPVVLVNPGYKWVEQAKTPTDNPKQ